MQIKLHQGAIPNQQIKINTKIIQSGESDNGTSR